MNRYEITASNNDVFSLFAFDRQEGLPKTATVALLSCDSCHADIFGNNSVIFGCPKCAGNMNQSATKEMTADDMKKMKKVAECTFCDSTLFASSEALPAFKDNGLHCPMCLNEVEVKAATSFKADGGDGDNSEAANPDMDSDAETDDNTDDEDNADLGSDEETDPKDLPKGDDEESDDPEKDDSEDDNSDEENNESKEEEDSEKDDENEDDDSKDEDKKDEEVDVGDSKGDSLEASLLAAVGDKKVDINIMPSPDRKRWYLFADNTPVAISEKGRCSEEIRDLFNTDRFMTAYLAASAEGVTQDVLDDFGFEPVVTKVPVEEAVKQTVEAQVNERTKKFNLQAGEYGERFEQCFGIAAMGLNNRFFNDKNPVIEALVPILRNCRVNDAHNIVVKAFEENTPALLKTLVLRATDLMEKDDAYLNDIAKLVQEKPVSSEEKTVKTPPAALSTFEEHMHKKEPAEKEVTASEGDDDIYGKIFQLNKIAR